MRHVANRKSRANLSTRVVAFDLVSPVMRRDSGKFSVTGHLS